MMEIAHFLERASSGTGDLLVVVGPHGSGKTAVLDAAVEEGRRHGFEVVRATFQQAHLAGCRGCSCCAMPGLRMQLPFGCSMTPAR